MDILLLPCSLHAALSQLGEQDDECEGLFLQPSLCFPLCHFPCLGLYRSHRGAGALPNDRTEPRWSASFIQELARVRAHLVKDESCEFANHHAFLPYECFYTSLSLPAWEIALGLHDTAQTEQALSRSVGREEPDTVAH
jgi:hypothetical protein